MAHNGEINTLRGNVNWMHARESMFASPLFGEDMEKLFPIIAPAGSDSAGFDNALELLVHTGRPISHAVMMMIPEAWQKHESMSAEKRDFYRYHACLTEAWDGPASIAFSDGTVIGAVLDRNGLRPSRYVVTKDGLVVMASEVGVLDIAPENVLAKGRLQPGRMFLVDIQAGRIIADEELKAAIATPPTYGRWLDESLTRLVDLPAASAPPPEYDDAARLTRQQAFGYTIEDLRFLMSPMALNGQEAVGSMGTDTPLAVLSNKPQLLFNYFKQLFAQVTNPPIDPIREELVMSLKATIGCEENLFEESARHCRQLEIEEPVIDNEALAKIKGLQQDKLKTVTHPDALSRPRRRRGAREGALRPLLGGRDRDHRTARRCWCSPTAAWTRRTRRSRACSRRPRSTTSSFAAATARAAASSSSRVSRARCNTSRCSSATARGRSIPTSRSRR